VAIQISQAVKRFGDVAAVDSVSLDVHPGEFFAILGASGCGKTTLLRLIAGLEPLDEGEIRLDDLVVSGPGRHLPPERRNVGVVFQSYALWPHLTVAENVSFPLEAAGAGRRAARERIGGILSVTGLAALADRKPAALSGGQRQRVALARCLAQGAGTILMDEPLANLDPHLRAAMEDELVRFHTRSGASTLYITHDQREAMAMADRIAVMAAGRLLQVDRPEVLYRQPADERVARFVGRSAVVDARLEQLDGTQGLLRIGGRPVPARIGPGMQERPGSSVRAVIRPDGIAVGVPDGSQDDQSDLVGTVSRASYRGTGWEAAVAVDGISEPLIVTSPRALGQGETVSLAVRDAWVLPASGASGPPGNDALGQIATDPV